jgi:hypothetical protein
MVIFHSFFMYFGYVNSLLMKMVIEIVDLAIKNGGYFHRFFVGLPGRVSHGYRPVVDRCRCRESGITEAPADSDRLRRAR